MISTRRVSAIAIHSHATRTRSNSPIAPPASSGLFRALAHRPFALIWAGQTVSRLGDSVHTIALAWWVLEETGSATAMGTVLVFSTVPELLFLLVGGVAVDRFSRLWLMLASDLLRGGLSLLIALLAWRDTLALWHLFGIAAVFGLARALFVPAFTATVPDLLPDEVLPSANSLRALSRQVGGIVGPALGGLLVAGGGSAVAFTLDASLPGSASPSSPANPPCAAPRQARPAHCAT